MILMDFNGFCLKLLYALSALFLVECIFSGICIIAMNSMMLKLGLQENWLRRTSKEIAMILFSVLMVSFSWYSYSNWKLQCLILCYGILCCAFDGMVYTLKWVCTSDWHYIYFNPGLSEQEKSSVSEVLSTSKEHSETIQNLVNDHSQQSACIEQHAIDTFGQKYAVCSFLLH